MSAARPIDERRDHVREFVAAMLSEDPCAAIAAIPPTARQLQLRFGVERIMAALGVDRDRALALMPEMGAIGGYVDRQDLWVWYENRRAPDTRYVPLPCDLSEYRSWATARKSAVHARDGYRCRYCGRKRVARLDLDHVVPICQGGSNAMSNLVAACRSCNQKKGPRTPEQAKMKLRTL